MIIRKATLLDLKHIISLEEEWKNEYPCWGKGGFLKEFEKENSATFIALIDDAVVGFINIWFFVDLVEVNSLIVSKKFLRKGIASKLINHVFLFSKERGIKRIILEVNEKNKPAISLYEKLGFSVYNIRKKYYDFNYDAIMMEVFL